MKVRIKRIDDSLPLPEYQTEGAVAFDLYSREDIVIPAKSLAFIPTNIIVEIPKGYLLGIYSRSSTPKRKGLLIPHGVGIIDQDHYGPTDEILYQTYNYTDQEVKIERGERIGQAAFMRVDQAEWDESTKNLKPESRGNFGSTG